MTVSVFNVILCYFVLFTKFLDTSKEDRKCAAFAMKYCLSQSLKIYHNTPLKCGIMKEGQTLPPPQKKMQDERREVI